MLFKVEIRVRRICASSLVFFCHFDGSYFNFEINMGDTFRFHCRRASEKTLKLEICLLCS